jgi:hypothetical protein
MERRRLRGQPAPGGPRRKGRGLLVSYSGYPDMLNYFLPDNGLANLAGALLAAGHAVTILDYETPEMVTRSCSGAAEEPRRALRAYRRTHDRDGKYLMEILTALEQAVRKQQQVVQWEIARDITERIRREGIDFVGFKLWEGPGYKGSVRIAEWIRQEHPSLCLLAGGPHADIYGRTLLSRTSVFDALAVGDGEETMVALGEFALRRRRLRDVPNVMFRDGSGLRMTRRRWIADLDRLPVPCYAEDVYPALGGHRKIRVLTLDDSRGCPNRCHFCIHPLKSSSRRRWKSPRRIQAEVMHLRDRYGCSCFRFAGSSPSLLASRDGGTNSPEVLPAGMRYTGFLHGGDARHIDLARAHAQGCRAVFIGLESADARLLREVYGKKTTRDEIAYAIVASRQAGIYTVVSVIFPGPYETDATRRATLDFLMETRPDAALVLPPRILPGTEWDRHHQNYGFAYTVQDFPGKLMEFERPHFLPVLYGEPLCFTVNGKDHPTQMRQAVAFAAELERCGITIGVSDEAALLAGLAGYEGREAQFRNAVAQAFRTGQTEQLEHWIRMINQEVARLARLPDSVGAAPAGDPTARRATPTPADSPARAVQSLC